MTTILEDHVDPEDGPCHLGREDPEQGCQAHEQRRVDRDRNGVGNQDPPPLLVCAEAGNPPAVGRGVDQLG